LKSIEKPVLVAQSLIFFISCKLSAAKLVALALIAHCAVKRKPELPLKGNCLGFPTPFIPFFFFAFRSVASGGFTRDVRGKEKVNKKKKKVGL